MIEINKEKKSKKEHIPQTDSITELADFWDTHDITDFEDDLAEVKEAVFERRKELKIQLEPDEAGEIERLAKSREITCIELIHEWVREKLKAA